MRVLVLGDSMMQGTLVGDSETPPAQASGPSVSALDAPVSVLNTGHLGYSPEQYAQTLRAFGDRFRPHYVVISVFTTTSATLDDPAIWDEGEYWIDQITELCNRRRWEFLLVPAPEEFSLLGRRELHRFQGHVCRIFKRGGANYVDPLESFTDVLLRLQNDAVAPGHPHLEPFVQPSPDERSPLLAAGYRPLGSCGGPAAPSGLGQAALERDARPRTRGAPRAFAPSVDPRRRIAGLRCMLRTYAPWRWVRRVLAHFEPDRTILFFRRFSPNFVDQKSGVGKTLFQPDVRRGRTPSRLPPRKAIRVDRPPGAVEDQVFHLVTGQ